MLRSDITSGKNKGKQSYCTVELIAPRVAITARHCTTDKQFVTTARIVFGAISRAPGSGLPDGTQYQVKTLKKNGDSDIAVLGLSQDVTGVQPVPVAPSALGDAVQRGVAVTAVGWGDTSVSPRTSSLALHYASQAVIKRDDSKDRAHDAPGASAPALLTAPGSTDAGGTFRSTQQWAYEGDSGGALLVSSGGQDYLTGIFSEFELNVRRNAVNGNFFVNIGADGKWGRNDWVNKTVQSLETIPSPPTGLTVQADSGGLHARWSPPVDDGGSPISGYSLVLSHDGSDMTPVDVDAATHEYTFDQVAAGETYTVYVSANNAIGASEYASATADTVGNIVFDYESAGWKYLDTTPGASAGFQDPAFDDSGWAIGQAGFGTVDGTCSWNNADQVHTQWTPLTDMLVRRHFSVPTGATTLHLSGSIDNTASIYLNGTLVATASSGFCDAGAISLDIPATGLPADSVLAIRASDDGSATYLDVQMTAS